MTKAKRAKQRRHPFSGWSVWKHCTRHGLLQTTALQAVTAAAVLVAPMAPRPAFALSPTAQPTGGQVTSGAANISQTPTQTTINQSSQNAAINWQSYNVGSAHTVQYNDPSSTSVTFNRVTGANPSEIAGRIVSNGTVVIVNRAGMVFDQGAQVNVAGLVASAAGISDANIKAYNTTGRMVFDQAANPGATIVNNGKISIKDHGLASLVAPAVVNAGTIQAKLGTVVLGGAEAYSLDLYGDGMVGINVTKQVATAADGTKALITNTGVVSAAGGKVLLTADAVDGVVQTLVNAGGTISANSVGAKTGKVVIAGAGGDVEVTGTVSANGRSTGSTGGAIAVNSTGTVTLAPTARITANGPAGGGTIAVGTTLKRAAGGPSVTGQKTAAAVNVRSGATVAANATQSGNGGNVTVLSAGTTTMNGRLTATGGAQGGNGGLVEVSGNTLAINTGSIDVSAARGSAGSILFDPDNLTIVASGGGIDGTFTGTLLAGTDAGLTDTLSGSVLNGITGNVTLQATNTLDVASSFTIGSGGLTMQAGQHLSIDAGVTVSATGNILAQTTASGIGIGIAGLLTSSGGSVTLLTPANSQIALANTGTVSVPTAGKSIVLQSDTLFMNFGKFSTPSGTIEIAPVTAGTTISFGSNSSGGTLGLGGASTSLGAFSASLLRVGAANGTTTASDIVFGANTDLTGIASTLDVHGTGTVSRATNSTVLTVGTLTGSAGGDLLLAGGVSTGNVIGTIGSFSVGANNQFQVLTNGGVTIAGPVNAGTLFYAADVSGSNPTIAVTGSIGATQAAILSSVAGTIAVTGTINSPAVTLGTYGTVQITGASAVVGQAGGTLALGAAGGATQASTGTILAGTLSPVAGIGLGSVSLLGTANAVSSLGSISASGDFALVTTNAVTVTNTLAATGNIYVQSLNAGGTTIGAAGSVLAGAAKLASFRTDSFTNSGTVTGGTFELAPNTNGRTLALGTGGDLVNLSGIGATTVRLGAVTNPGTSTQTITAGSIAIGSDFGASNVALDLRTNGTITQTAGSLTASTLSGAAAAAVLTGVHNQIGTIGNLAVTKSLQLFDAEAVTVTGTVNTLIGAAQIQDSAAGGITVAATGSLATATGQTLTMQTDAFSVASGGSVSAPSGTIELAPWTSGGVIDFSGTGAGTLALTQATLNGLSASLLRLGQVTIGGTPTVSAGGVTLDANVTLTSVASTLDVQSSGSVRAANNSVLTIGTLTGSIAGDIDLVTAGGHDTIGVVGSLTSGSGSIVLDFANSPTIAGPLSATDMTLQGAANVTITGSVNAPGSFYLLASSTITSSGSIVSPYVAMQGNGGIAITGGQIGQAGGEVRLNSSTTEDASAKIIAGTLDTTGGSNGFSLNGTANAIDSISTLFTGGSIVVVDASALTITQGVSAGGGLLLQDSNAGGISIGAGATVAAGATTTAGFRTDTFANSGTATGGTFELAPNTPNTQIKLGSAGDYLASLTGIGPTTVRIGAVTMPGSAQPTTTAGNITIDGAFGSAGVALDLRGSGTLSQSAGKALTAGTLTGSAAAVALTETVNAVGTLGSFTSTNDFSLGNGQALTVAGTVTAGPVTAGPNVANTNTLSLTVPNSTLTLGATGQPAVLNAGTILLNAGGGITQPNGTAIANSMSAAAAAGAIMLNNANNNVTAMTGASAGNGDLVLVFDPPTVLTGLYTGKNVFIEVAVNGGSLQIGSNATAATLQATAASNPRISLVSDTVTEGTAGGTLTATGGSVEVAPWTASANVAVGGGSPTYDSILLGLIANSGATTVTFGRYTDEPNGGTLVSMTGSLAMAGSLAMPNMTLTAGTVGITGSLNAGTLLALGASSGGVNAAGATLSAATLASVGTITGTLALTGSNTIGTIGSVAVASGDFILADTGSVSVAGPVSAQTVSLTAGTIGIPGTVTAGTLLALGASAGGIAETGTLNVGTLASIGTVVGGASFTGSNTIGTLANFAVTGGDFTLASTGSLAATGSIGAPNITLSAGTLTIPGTLNAGTTVALGASAGGVSESGAINATTLASVGTIVGGATLSGVNAIGTIGAFVYTGAFALSDTQALTIANTLTAGVGDSIALTLPSLTIAATGVVNVGTVTINTTSGGVTEQSGGLLVTNALSIATNGAGDVSLINPNNQIAASTGIQVANGNLVLVDDPTLTLTGTQSAANLIFKVTGAGDTIAVGNGGTAATLLTTGSGGRISLVADQLTENASSSITANGGTVEIAPFTATQAVALGGANGGGTLGVDTTLLATLNTSTLVVGRYTDITSTVSTTAVHIDVAGPVTLTGKAPTLFLATPGSVFESIGPLTVGTLTGTVGAFGLLNAGNNIGSIGTFSVTGGKFSLDDSGNSSVLTVAGPVTATLVSINNGSNSNTGTIAITGNVGASTLIDLSAGTGGITESSTGILNATTSGGVRLSTTGGGITQTGNLGTIIAGTLLSSSGATGTVSLFSSTNTIGTLGAFAITNGDFALKDSTALAVTGSVGVGATGNITLNATGLTLAATETLAAPGGTLDVTTTAGGVTQDPAGVVNVATLLSSGGINGGSVNLAGTNNAIAMLTHVSVAAGGSFNLRNQDGGTLTVTGAAPADAITADSVTITSGVLNQDWIVTAGVGAATLVATTGTLAQAGTVNAVTGASLTGQTNLDNAATGTVTVSNGAAVLLANTGTLGQAGSVSATTGGTLTAATYLTNSGSMTISGGPATLTATGNDLTQSGVVQGTVVGETAGGSLTHSGTSTATSTTATLFANGGSLSQSGTVNAVTYATLTAHTNLDNTATGVVSVSNGGATLVASTGTLGQAGSVSATSFAGLTGQTGLTNGGVVTVSGPSGAATLLATTGTLTNSGTVQTTGAAGTVTETASTGPLNSSGLTSAGSGGATLTATKGTVTQSAGTVLANGGTVGVTAGTSIMQSGGTIETSGNGGTLIALIAQGTAVGNGITQAAGALIQTQATGVASTITLAADLASLSGTIIAGGTAANNGVVAVSVAGTQLAGAGGTAITDAGFITGGSAITETATQGDIVSTGTSTAGNGGVTLTASNGSVQQTAGLIQAVNTGTVTLSAATANTNATSGTIALSGAASTIQTQNGDLTLSADTLISQQAGTVQTTGTTATLIQLTQKTGSAGGITQAATGLIQASATKGSVGLNAVGSIVTGGSILATDPTSGTVSAAAGTFLTNSGVINAGTLATLVAQTTLTNSGTVANTGTGGSIIETAVTNDLNSSGLTSAGSGGATLTATKGTVTQSAGTILANGGTVGVTAGTSVVQSGGTIETSGNGGTLIALIAQGTAVGNGITQAAGALIQTQATGVASTITLAADLASLSGTIIAGGTAANNGVVAVSVAGTQLAGAGGTAITDAGFITGGSAITEAATQGDIVSTGTSTAGNGGITLTASNGSVRQTAGLIQAVNTGTVTLSAATANTNATSGTIALSGAASTIQTQNGNLTLSADTLISQQAGTVQTTGTTATLIQLTQKTGIAGGITQAATGLIQASATKGSVGLNAVGSIVTGGSILATDATSGTVSAAAGTFLTNSGVINAGTLATLVAQTTLTNSGTVANTGTGGSIIETATASNLNSSGLTSAGSGGATLTAGGTLTQTGGIITAANGPVALTGTVSIVQNGGTIRTTGTTGGTVSLTADGTTTGTGITQKSGTVSAVGNATLTAQNTISLGGLVTATNNTVLNAAGSSLLSAGTVAGTAITETGSLNAGNALTGTATLGNIVVGAAGTVAIVTAGAGGISLKASDGSVSLTNGTVQATGGAVQVIAQSNTADTKNSSGTITVTSGLMGAANGNLTATADRVIAQNGGTIQTSGTAGGNVLLASLGTTTDTGIKQSKGTVSAAGNATLTARNTIALAGLVTAAGTAVVNAGGASLLNAGTVSGPAINETGSLNGGTLVSGTATLGDIVVGNGTGSGVITAGSGGVGLTATDGSISVTAGTIQGTGGPVTLIAQSNPADVQNNSGTITQTLGLIAASNANVSATADVSVVQNDGTIQTTGTASGVGVSLTANGAAGGISLMAGTVQAINPAGTVSLTAVNAINLNGLVQATDTAGTVSAVAQNGTLLQTGSVGAGSLTTLQAAQDLSNYGSITAGNQATLQSVGGNVNQAGSVGAGGILETAAGDVAHTGTSSAGSGGATLTAGNNVVQTGGLITAADGNVRLTGTVSVVQNSGTIQTTGSTSGKGVTVTSLGTGVGQGITLAAPGTVQALNPAGTVTLSSANLITMAGLVQATDSAGTVTVGAQTDLTNAGSVLAGTLASLTSSTTNLDQDGVVNAATITETAAINVNHTGTSSAGTGGATLTAGQNVVQTGGLITAADGPVAITGTVAIVQNSGTISTTGGTGGTVSLAALGTGAAGGISQSAPGLISATGDATLTASNTLGVAGSVLASNNVVFAAAGTALTNAGTVSGTAINESGTVIGTNAVTQTATLGDIVSTGSIGSGAGGITLLAGDGSMTQNGGTIQASGGTIGVTTHGNGNNVSSGQITQTAGLITATGSIGMTADVTLTQTSGTISTTAGSAPIVLTAYGVKTGDGINQTAGLISANGDATLISSNTLGLAGTVLAGNDVVFAVAGSALSSGGTVSGTAINESGTVIGSNAVTQTATLGDIVSAGSIGSGAGGTTLLASDGSVTQNGGTIQATSGTIGVTAHHAADNAGSGVIAQTAGVITASGNLGLTADISVLQTAGTISTTGGTPYNVAINANGTTGSSGITQAAAGTIAANGNATLTAANLVTQRGQITAGQAVAVTAGGAALLSGGTVTGTALTQSGVIAGGTAVTETATLGDISLSGSSTAGSGGLTIQAQDGLVTQTAGMLKATNTGTVAIGATQNANNPTSGAITQSAGTIMASGAARLRADQNLLQSEPGVINAPEMDFFSTQGSVSIYGTLSGLAAGTRQSMTPYTIPVADFPAVGSNGIFITVGSAGTSTKQVITYAANGSLAVPSSAPSGHPDLAIIVLNNEPVVVNINAANHATSLTDLFLILQTGGGSGTINTSSLHVDYVSPGTMGKATLEGTVNNIGGPDAAAGSFIKPIRNANYLLNGCAIGSSSCISISSVRVPVTNPLKDIDFGAPPPPSDINVMLPDVAERDY
jgi:filamentous hemagglutinin family protein